MVVGFFLTQLRTQVIRRAHYGMREICCLVQHFSDAQIPDLDLVLPCQKHVDRLDVSMQNLVSMKVLNSEAHLEEEPPYGLFGETLAHLTLEIKAEIPILAVFHDYVNVALLRERVVIFHDVGTIHPS